MIARVGEWLAQLLPEAYLRYLPVLQRGFEHFLRGLPGARQAEVWQAQSRLSPEAGAAERMVALLRHCPTLHKLGQILARDPRLDSAFRDRLRSLESCLPLAEIDDFSWPADLQPRQALAEGSVASVFACEWRGHPVVSKRLKPGVAAHLSVEFAIWTRLGEELGGWCRTSGLPVFDYASAIASLIQLLQDELQPQREQNQLLLAAQRFAEQPIIHIPRVYPQIVEGGVVMERLTGTPLLAHPLGSQMFPLAVQVLFTDPFFSAEEETIFHLDPHPGNLWVTDSGRLALLDWGSTLSLSKHRRLLLTHSLLSAWRGDQQDWEFFAGQLTGSPVGPVPRAGSLSGLLDPDSWGGQLPLDLILLRKILFHLEGVEAQLGLTTLGWELFVQAGARFLAELPLRLSAPAHWRGFSTHLSNLDIVRHAVLKFWGHSQ